MIQQEQPLGDRSLVGGIGRGEDLEWVTYRRRNRGLGSLYIRNFSTTGGLQL